MSDSFMVAARIPMTREAFEAWLDTPTPDPAAVIANPTAVFDGWYWDGRAVEDEWESVETTTPREYFADRVGWACDGEPETTVLLHRDGALEAYLFHLGYDEAGVHTALALLAAAGPHKSADAEDVVLFWAETSGSLWRPEDKGWLAVLAVGRTGARFVADLDLAPAVAALKPVEQRFFELVDRLGEAEESWDSEGEYRTGIPREESFVDPAVLRAG
ncbi:hypothetical protein [Actinosynnema sp. NPDC020468]|uniref:hypothetical protein n=1 Tax=Actinosynnema sp. NPDC020468 TaxID=3154488 RepID=UPI0033FDE2A7